MELILASTSPRRKELLKQCGLTYRAVSPSIDETLPSAMTPREAVAYLSEAKARACLQELNQECLVIGADTVVALDGTILGKPGSAQEAIQMLERLSGRSHQVFTGVTLLHPQRKTTFVSCTNVCFYSLSKEEISRYVATGEPMDKAGAYGIQGLGGLLVEKIEGDYYTVVGLPIARLMRELRTEYSDRMGEWTDET